METIQGIRVKPIKPWDFSERSTRNCVHAKVCQMHGKEQVHCGKGKHLAEQHRVATEYSISLGRVLKMAKWASEACQYCEYFEHDIEGDEN